MGALRFSLLIIFNKNLTSLVCLSSTLALCQRVESSAMSKLWSKYSGTTSGIVASYNLAYSFLYWSSSPLILSSSLFNLTFSSLVVFLLTSQRIIGIMKMNLLCLSLFLSKLMSLGKRLLTVSSWLIRDISLCLEYDVIDLTRFCMFCWFIVSCFR